MKNCINRGAVGACILVSMLLSACGGGGSSGSVPGAPTNVSVAVGSSGSTTASVSFTAPANVGSAPITSYTVTASPGGIHASGASSPIALTGLTPQTAYTYSVVANNSVGTSTPATTGALNFYNVVETFHEPMTQPNNSVFTGTFTYDATNLAVSNLKGSLTEAMSMANPIATVALDNQLSSVGNSTLGGLLVTTFALTNENTFLAGGFAPSDAQTTYGNDNAFAMIFVNTINPTTTLTQAQINMLAYADCTPGGLMMTYCMTGTTVAGYGQLGSMNGYPTSEVVTLQ